MPLLGVDTHMGLMTCLYRWTTGGTVIYGPPGLAALPVALQTLAPEILVIATGQLAALLDLLPEGFAMPGAEVFVAGGLVSRGLAKRSLACFGRGLTIIYGSTEAAGATAGRAGMLDAAPDAVGWAYPDREIEILDAAGPRRPAWKAKSASAAPMWQPATSTTATARRRCSAMAGSIRATLAGCCRAACCAWPGGSMRS